MQRDELPQGIALVCLVLMSDRNSSMAERKFLCDLILALAGKNEPIIAFELEGCGIYDLETAEKKVFPLIKNVADQLHGWAQEFPSGTNYLDVLSILAREFLTPADEPHFRFWFGVSLFASTVDNEESELAARLARYEKAFLQMLYKIGPAGNRLNFKKYCALARKQVSKRLS